MNRSSRLRRGEYRLNDRSFPFHAVEGGCRRIEQLTETDQCQLNQQALFGGRAVSLVAVAQEFQGCVIPVERELRGLLSVTPFHLLALFHEGERGFGGTHHKVADVVSQTVDEEERIESFFSYLSV